MSLLGFNAVGRLALGQIPSPGTIYLLTADTVTFSLSGSAALFRVSEAASTGSYSVTGVSATFTSRFLAASTAYAVSGQAAFFRVAMTCATGAYAISGAAVLRSLIVQGVRRSRYLRGVNFWK